MLLLYNFQILIVYNQCCYVSARNSTYNWFYALRNFMSLENWLFFGCFLIPGNNLKSPKTRSGLSEWSSILNQAFAKKITSIPSVEALSCSQVSECLDYLRNTDLRKLKKSLLVHQCVRVPKSADRWYAFFILSVFLPSQYVQ